MAMSSCLEITFFSAEDVRVYRKCVKGNAFVAVQQDPSNIFTTKMDTEGGSYPAWNDKLKLDLPLHAKFITAEVKCKTSTGIKSVGSARIPVSDFIGGYVPEDQVHFLSYRLWDRKWRRNGIINVSVRVNSPEDSFSTSQPTEGVPVSEHNCSEVVTGVPVWLYYIQ